MALASPARAQEERHPGAHHDDHPNVLGVRTGSLSVFMTEEEELVHVPGMFLGASYERVVLHDWLEIELSVPVATLVVDEETKLVMPMDLHFKLPFHPSPAVSPYLAAGPAVDVELRPHTDVFFGASFAVGTYVWSSEKLGLDVEADYNVVEEEHVVHELLFAVGPVYRF